MAAGSGDNLGELTILISGDLTPLETALNDILPAAEQIGAKLSTALSGADSGEGLQQSLGAISDSLSTIGEQATQTGQDLANAFSNVDSGAIDQATQSIDQLGGAVPEVTDSVKEISPAMHDVGEETGGATEKLQEFLAQGLEIAGITLSIEALKEALVESVEAFAEFQRAGESLTALTGSAEEASAALEKIPGFANQLGQSIPNLENFQQQLTRFGVALDQIPAAMQAASDASRAANVDFSTAASALERIANSGQVSIRTLGNAGVTLQGLGEAMGMSGASATQLSTALKSLGTDSDAITARWQILEAATSNYAGISQKTADDVKGSWQKIANAVHEAQVNIGDSLDQLGSEGGVAALKDVIGAIETVILSLVAGVNLVVDAVKILFAEIAGAFAGLGQAMIDIANGNFQKAWQDLVKGSTDSATAVQTAAQQMASDWGTNAALVAKIWGDTATAAADSTNSIADSMSKVQSLADLQLAAFNRVATAYALGKASATEYTNALTALNKAQIEANNGLQQAPTVLLLVENAYRELGVTATNAATNLVETQAALNAGRASWTQYTAAMEAFDKAVLNITGGLQTLATAANTVEIAFNQAEVNLANAQTLFNTVADAVQHGGATFLQYTTALKALNQAQQDYNSGAQTFATAVLLAQNAQAQLRVSAQNATTALKAQLDVYNQTNQGLPQLISLTNAYVKAQEASSNGAISWASANLEIGATESQLELNVSNANTLLAQAAQKYADGSIHIGTYNKYLQAAQQAQDALTGATKTGTSAAQAATSAQNSLSASVNGVAENFKVATGAILTHEDAVNQITQNYKQLQINLLNAQTWLSAVQDAYNNNKASGLTLVTALQGVIKAQNDLNAATGTTTGAMSQQINALENMVGQTAPAAAALQNVGTAALNTAANVQTASVSIGDSINSIAQDAFQATQTLDAFFNSLGQGTSSSGGSLSAQVNPGTQISQIINGVVTTVDPGGLPGAPKQSTTTSSTPKLSTTTTTSATQSTTTVVDSSALQASIDNLSSVITQLSSTISSFTTALSGTSQGVIAAAGNLSSTTSGLSSTTSNLSTTVANLGAVTSTAAQTVSSAAGVVNSAITTAALGTAAVTALLTAVNASPSNATSLLNLGAAALTTTPGLGTNGANSLLLNQPAGYYSPYVGGQAPPNGVVVNVNVSGNQVVGPGAAQQLANTIMQTAVSKLRTVAGLKINV